MTTAVSASSTLSGSEIATAISMFSDSEWIRLYKAAKACSHGVLDPDDLLQEAFLSALEERRRCPRGIDIVRFLAEAIRSLASSRFKSLNREPEQLELSPEDESNIRCYRPTSEDHFISAQEVRRLQESMKRLFHDDPVALTILESEMDGVGDNEIYLRSGLDKIAFASKRRLIRRRIERAFPRGWE